jgi:hypothetical protein
MIEQGKEGAGVRRKEKEKKKGLKRSQGARSQKMETGENNSRVMIPTHSGSYQIRSDIGYTVHGWNISLFVSWLLGYLIRFQPGKVICIGLR